MVRIHPSQPNTTRFHNTRHRNHIRHKRKHPVFVTPTRSRRSLLTTLLLHSNKPRFTRKRSIVNTPFTLTEIQNLTRFRLIIPGTPVFPAVNSVKRSEFREIQLSGTKKSGITVITVITTRSSVFIRVFKHNLFLNV
ncbi:hypothetical protein HanRHA438_Chr17g0792341 [Helianthus annuus]|nr:hypothetical protein HanRHA438_Chr17g0792341 [Helianthus annuus]